MLPHLKGLALLHATVLLLLLLPRAASGRRQLNLRPVLGIMAQPIDPGQTQYGSSYLTASYVKWVEAAGARVIPLHYERGADYFAKMLASIDGVLLPGGDLPLNDTSTPYYARVREAVAHALKFRADDDGSGEHFVLWGTCQGFQQIAIVSAAEEQKAWGYFGAENISLPLDFEPGARSSRLYGEESMSEQIFRDFASKPVTQNLHHEGVSPDRMRDDPNLAKLFRVLSTNRDTTNARRFVSSFEAYDHDIYATQYHPERNAFEWEPSQQIDHSLSGIRCTQHLANFLVDRARRSNASLRNPAPEEAFIGHDCPTWTYDLPGWIDDQCYFWK